MTAPLPLTHRGAMVEASRRAAAAKSVPEALRWQAVWWRLHAKESRVPWEPRQYAINLMQQARAAERAASKGRTA